MKRGETYADPATGSTYIVDHVRRGVVYLSQLDGQLHKPFGVPVHFASRVLKPAAEVAHSLACKVCIAEGAKN